MEKRSTTWSIDHLSKTFNSINFPDFQREPTVWSPGEKRRLIDSITRGFDISTIFLYENGENEFDCIDGRQRLSAIMAFLGEFPQGEDNGFTFKSSNEIYVDPTDRLSKIQNLRYNEIQNLDRDGDADEKAQAKKFLDDLLGYELSVTILSNAEEAPEFHLQFTRLNVGAIINADEMLNAMMGDMHDVCFGKTGDTLWDHEFLEATKIPTRRYAKQGVTAQVLMQAFHQDQHGTFARMRQPDLVNFLKEFRTMESSDIEKVQTVRTVLDALHANFGDTEIIRNRAMAVSTILFARQENIIAPEEVANFGAFLSELLLRIKWQAKEGFDIRPYYRYLITEFQIHVTQASVEKPAIQHRDTFIKEAWDFGNAEDHTIKGDSDYIAETRQQPGEVSRDVLKLNQLQMKVE